MNPCSVSQHPRTYPRTRWALLLIWGLWCLAGPATTAAQVWSTFRGQVVNASDGQGIPGATILVVGTNFGTAADMEGRFTLRLPEGTYALRYSAIGYATKEGTVDVNRLQPTVATIRLVPTTVTMEELTVEGDQGPDEAGVFRVAPEDARNLPTPARDIVRVLKVMPGVASTNEMSNQYSVRGGGYNENLLFLNGFEIFLPFRPRQGEQEGLSLLNPDLAQSITLYSGAFPVTYGGKLSSALDVGYRWPATARPTAGVSMSLLDMSAYSSVRSRNQQWGMMLGLRKAQAQHFFETQELKGTYDPRYRDGQMLVVGTPTDWMQIEVLGIVADHRFFLDPSARKTYFGTLSQDSELGQSDLRSLWVSYDPSNREEDGYTTLFGATRIGLRLSAQLRTEIEAAYYDTEEVEFFELSGRGVLYQVDPGSGDPDQDENLYPTGVSRQESRADNQVNVTMLTLANRWRWTKGDHAVVVGAQWRPMSFSDQIDEKSIVIGPTLTQDVARIVLDSLQDEATLSETQVGIYLQDTWAPRPSWMPGELTITGGIRADYFSFNDEWTVSPRVNARYVYSERTTFTAAVGHYTQHPTYRELRGIPEPGTPLAETLNRTLRSQRATQGLLGVEHFLPKRRLIARAEAYYKRMTDVISYDIQNIRVNYAGENNAKAYAAGLDLQLKGEFVPGLESWLNYSYLRTEEILLPAFQTAYASGWHARPTDQRHTLSLFVQDYVPSDPSWKLHLRTLFGSGLPYTPPVPGPKLGTFETQIPGPKASGRYPRYFRFDMGATKRLTLFDEIAGHPVEATLGAELLNVFDMVNTVAYTWIPNQAGIWNRIPTRLTPRTYNVRFTLQW